jgi:c-di-GMP-related signal transduction protein
MGYELLFREGMSNYFPNIDGNLATSKVLTNTFISIGIEPVAGAGKAFVNFTQDLLLNRIPLMFPKERIAVEILEDVNPEKELIAACREIRQKGYQIALDDFLYRPELEPLVDLATMIKFDVRATPLEELAEPLQRLSGRDIALLAEKVETHEEFVKAREMGFDFFQGYFFSKPEVLRGKDISSSKMNLLQIMAEANKEDFDFQEIEQIAERDVAISYKLMRYINSAYFKRVSEISSINQAVVMLGERGIRRFLSLIAMSGLASDKPDELVRTSIIRAKFCELIAEMEGAKKSPSELFTLGLFSLIDAILDDSMENLMAKLPLSEAIKRALVATDGELRDYLNLVHCYEAGDWQGVSELAPNLGVNEEALPPHYQEALGWADSLAAST